MESRETDALTRTLRQFNHLMTTRLPRCSIPLPGAVEVALLRHVAVGVRAIQQAHDAPVIADGSAHLVQALTEWRAAVALLQEWTAPE